jgi:WD40 repeat protein
MQANAILLWDVATGKVTRRIPRHRVPAPGRYETIPMRFPIALPGIALSPDTMTIATADNPLHSVTLWDVATGQRKTDFSNAPAAPVRGLACSSDGARIATGGRDGTVQLWESATGKPLLTLALSDAPWCEVHSIAFARDGQSVAAGGEDRQTEQDRGRARIWDLKSGAQRLEIRTDHDVAKIALSHDGSTLALATSNLNSFASRLSKDRREVEQEPEHWLLIVDAKTGAKRQRIKLAGYARALAFSPTGATIIAAEHSGALSTWDTATGQLVRTSDAHGGAASRQSDAMFSAAISADGSLAIMINGFSNDLATLWDLAKGKQIGQINFENESNLANVVAIAPDNRVIASALWGGEDHSPDKHSLRLWDARTGKLLKRYSPLSNRVVSLEFTPDGRRLISGMSDGSSLVWDAAGL